MKFVDFLNAAKKIEEEAQKGSFSEYKKIKIAFLPSFAANGIKEVLLVKCCDFNILPDIYVSDYNQYAQEILNAKSRLYRFNPEVIILFIDTKSIMGDLYFLSYAISDQERTNWVTEKLDELKNFIQKAKDNSGARIIIHNFEVPTYSPLGILENKQSFGFIESIQRLNQALRNDFKNDERVFILDYDSYCSTIGKNNVEDKKMYYLGDIKLRWEHMSALCDSYLAYIKPFKSIIRKCIVLDLDNTLWGGIAGEDSFEEIRLGPTPEGRPFWEFQKHLLSLSQRGVLLAINSKNNPEDALKIIREHPYMVLREDNFSSIQINWNDKITNMHSIADNLNIGSDSLVFIDDDKTNCELVQKALPEVLVVNLPDDPAFYSEALCAINDFNILQLTNEDLRRSSYYVSQIKRENLKKSSNIDEYLKELQTVVTINTANSFTISRISQLTQKTNQFNMTTKRYLEDDIKRFSQSDRFWVRALAVKDKFGDTGITGVAIVEKQDRLWRIDSFLLSCRVIGRKVEETFLAYILQEAKKNNITIVEGEFIHTKKNAVAKDFYKNNGFKIASKDGEEETWDYDTAMVYSFPDCVKLEICSE